MAAQVLDHRGEYADTQSIFDDPDASNPTTKTALCRGAVRQRSTAPPYLLASLEYSIHSFTDLVDQHSARSTLCDNRASVKTTSPTPGACSWEAHYSLAHSMFSGRDGDKESIALHDTGIAPQY